MQTSKPSSSGGTVAPPIDALTLAEALNHACFCRTVDQQRLQQELVGDENNADVYASTFSSRPHLFSSTAVFVSHTQLEQMRAVIQAVEAVVALPAYQAHVLHYAPAIAAYPSPPAGVFMGYDFHLGASGPKLIEINSNAGGAFLNAALLRAQSACCAEADAPLAAAAQGVNRRLMQMFRNEWQLQRGDRPLKSIAIVDEVPESQYLYPEFQLAQRLFQRQGLKVVIADATDLVWRDGLLFCRDTPIDLVYNRLTDFALEQPRHADLKQAYLQDAVVLTPHPRTHALYADKRNLTALTDCERLHSWGVPAALIETLQNGIPQTRAVEAGNIEQLWLQRKDLFFKPAAGFGSRAAYRGDKVTKKVWADISKGGYVAQQRVPPSERALHVDDQQQLHKLDIRAYVYSGQIQLLAARLYQGQTTNFRTPGGGFASVFVTG